MIKIMIYSYDLETIEEVKNILCARKERMNVYYSEFVANLLLFHLRNRDIDIIIMQIIDNNDIHAAKRFKVFNPSSLIIYLVENPQLYKYIYGIESFRVLKSPREKAELEQAINEALEKVTLLQSHFFMYFKNKKNYVLNYDNIVYFYSTHKVVNIKLKDGKELSFTGKLDDVQKQTEKKGGMFLRINKSFYVNRKFLATCEHSEITMMDGTIITVSRNYHNFE